MMATTSLRVAAALEALPTIRAFVDRASEAAGLDRRTAYRLRLAVDEIATNIVVHGHPGGAADATIAVEAIVDDNQLRIQLEDDGPAFDPLAHETPGTAQLERPMIERPIGGLGVFLAIRGVDEFRYERSEGSNRNVFIVRRPANTSSAAGA